MLLVELDFERESDVRRFLEGIDEVVEHVRRHEPGTLSYEVALSDKVPTKVVVMERYEDRENAYLDAHKSSAAFLAFRQKLRVMQDQHLVKVSGHSYRETGLGFV